MSNPRILQDFLKEIDKDIESKAEERFVVDRSQKEYDFDEKYEKLNQILHVLDLYISKTLDKSQYTSHFDVNKIRIFDLLTNNSNEERLFAETMLFLSYISTNKDMYFERVEEMTDREIALYIDIVDKYFIDISKNDEKGNEEEIKNESKENSQIQVENENEEIDNEDSTLNSRLKKLITSSKNLTNKSLDAILKDSSKKLEFNIYDSRNQNQNNECENYSDYILYNPNKVENLYQNRRSYNLNSVKEQYNNDISEVKEDSREDFSGIESEKSEKSSEKPEKTNKSILKTNKSEINMRKLNFHISNKEKSSKSIKSKSKSSKVIENTEKIIGKEILIDKLDDCLISDRNEYHMKNEMKSSKTINTDLFIHSKTISRTSVDEEWKDAVNKMKSDRLSTFHNDVNKYKSNRIFETKLSKNKFHQQKGKNQQQQQQQNLIQNIINNTNKERNSINKFPSNESFGSKSIISNSQSQISQLSPVSSNLNKKFKNIQADKNRTRFSVNTDALFKLESFQNKLKESNNDQSQSSFFFKKTSAMKTDFLEENGLLEFTHEMTNKIMQLENELSIQSEKNNEYKIINTRLQIEVKDLQEKNTIILNENQVYKSQVVKISILEEELNREKDEKEKYKNEYNTLLNALIDKEEYIKQQEKFSFFEKNELLKENESLKQKIISFGEKIKENEKLKKEIEEGNQRMKVDEYELLDRKINSMSLEINDLKKEKGNLVWKIENLTNLNMKKEETIKELMKESNQNRIIAQRAKNSFNLPISSRGINLDIYKNEEISHREEKISKDESLNNLDPKRYSVNSLLKLKKDKESKKSKYDLPNEENMIIEESHGLFYNYNKRSNQKFTSDVISNYSSYNESDESKEYNEENQIKSMEIEKSPSEHEKKEPQKVVSPFKLKIIPPDENENFTLTRNIINMKITNKIDEEEGSEKSQMEVMKIEKSPNRDFNRVLNKYELIRNIQFDIISPSKSGGDNKNCIKIIQSIDSITLTYRDYIDTQRETIPQNEINTIEDNNNELCDSSRKPNKISRSKDQILSQSFENNTERLLEVNENLILSLKQELEEQKANNSILINSIQVEKEKLNHLLIEKKTIVDNHYSQIVEYDKKLTEIEMSHRKENKEKEDIIDIYKRRLNEKDREITDRLDDENSKQMKRLNEEKEDFSNIRNIIKSKNEEISELNDRMKVLNNENSLWKDKYNVLNNIYEEEKKQFKNEYETMIVNLSLLNKNFMELQSEFIMKASSKV